MSLATELLEASVSNADPGDETTFLHRWDWLIARERNAIIEECAQLAENPKWTAFGIAPARIAAAIRELKDKPP